MTAVNSAVLFRSESKGSGSTPMNALKPISAIFKTYENQALAKGDCVRLL